MFIDIHTHIYNKKSLEVYLKKTITRDSKIIILNDCQNNINELLKFINPEQNLYLVNSIDTEKNIEEQIKINDKLFKKNKIFGIKLYPGYQHFYSSDKTIYPIAELCQKYDKPLIFHSGDVYDISGTANLKYAHPIHIDELAIRYPKCKIIISHFGFPYMLETANIVCKNKNVYTDISGIFISNNGFNEKELKALKKQYIDDLKRILNYFPEIKNKIMFGTDFSDGQDPSNTINNYAEIIEKIFNNKERKMAFYKLAENLFFE